MTIKTVTIADVVKAAEENGFVWTKNSYVDANPGVPTRACILGQIALNLGVDYSQLTYRLDDLGVDEGYTPLGRSIWKYNDDRARTYKGALRHLKNVLRPHMKETITMDEFGYLNVMKAPKS